MDCNDNDTNNIPNNNDNNNNVNNNLPGLFLLESLGIPDGDIGDAVSKKKYLTDEERARLEIDPETGEKRDAVHVRLLDIQYKRLDDIIIHRGTL